MLTVLVVDDEPFVRISMASLRDWSGLGFDFRYEAGNGQQALDLVTQHPEIDIVLLDLSMPVMDGISFLKALPPASMPAVIVLSAHDNYPLVRQSFTLGVKDYLLKTEVDGDTLLTILNKVAGDLGTREGREIGSPDQDLRDLLTSPPGPTPRPFPRPLVLWSLWIQDFEVVASRYGKDDQNRFEELFLRSVRQLVDKRGGGQVATMAADCVAVLSEATVEQDLFADHLKGSLERYLSVRLEARASPPLEDSCQVPGAWEELGRHRPGASRIVLLTKRYLRDHSARPVISLDELATHVGVSRNHLSWEFTKETGETITDYLARLRVEEACRLLVSTTLKVYEISERVGYPNVEHFCRVFKRITGTSPNRWASTADPQIFRDTRQ